MKHNTILHCIVLHIVYFITITMKTIYLYILILFSYNLHSQREDANWLVGYDNGVGGYYGISNISFDTILQSIPIMDTISSPIAFRQNNAIISDKIGNILFYTNGVVVMNKANDTMQNGNGLSPCSYTYQYEDDGLSNIQGSLILPAPTQDNLYYLFHETIFITGEPYADNFLYSIVDINGDNGKGTVIQKNVPILSNKQLSIGKITACKHANGKDWWIIKPDFYADKYYKFLLQSDGLHGPYIQSFNDTSMYVISNGPDQSGFTPDGSKYIHSCGWAREKVFIFDFDRCTGELSYKEYLKTQGLKGQYDLACAMFSPNSRLMYLSTGMDLYQYDLYDISITSSKQHIAEYDSFYSPTPICKTTFFMGVTAPNGKIYLSTTNSANKLHVINFPDSAGIACDFQQHAIQLPKIMAFGLPNFPNYHLGVLSGSACDTITNEQSAVNSEQVKVYPNPAKDRLYLEIPPEIRGECIFTLLSPQGQPILRKNIQKQAETIFVKELAKGMYLYRLAQAKADIA